MASWAFPALTAVLSAAFAGLVLFRYLKSRKTHQLLWTLGLFAIAGAAAAQVLYAVNGAWPEGVYRAYYFLIGSLVAVLGAGTVFLLNKPKLAQLFLYATVGLVGAQAAACSFTAINSQKLAAAGMETGTGIASGPMIALTIILSSMGAGALLVGALLSWWSTKRPHNLLIMGGTILFTIGGGTARVATESTGAAWALYLGNLAGITLLFAGFLLGRPSGAPAPQAPVSPAQSPPA